jgi:hypothetical protein
MKRAVLILMALLPLALAAQEGSPSPIQNQTGATNLLPSDALSISDYGSSAEAKTDADMESGVPPSNSQQPPNGQPNQSTKHTDAPGPSIPGTMVGYVDSAIVRSQVRVRFDAGFHDSAPDRAEFFYPQCACAKPLAPGPDFPGASTNINFQQVYLQAEYAPVSRLSMFVEIPFRWIEPQPNSFIVGSHDSNEIPITQTKGGISDVRAGLKLALTTSLNHSLTLQIRAYFPSGNGSLGLGTAHYGMEPSLLYYQRLSQRWAVESQIGDWHPIGGSIGMIFDTQTSANFAGDVFMYGIGPSYQLIDGEHFKLAPVVELFGWHVFGGLQTLSPFPLSNSICLPSGGVNGCSYEAGGTNIVNLKVGARTSFGNRNSVYIGFGQAVTHAVWYEHIIRIEYRYSF